MINKILIALSLVFISWGLQAHQPDLSSTMLVEQGKNKWVLQVRAALTAFEYEIEQHYGNDAYATPEEFQDLVIQHVQENIFLLFNETAAATLQNGLVKLGHETSVTFEVKGTPETIQNLKVKNSSFSLISRNQSALIVLKEGFAKKQFTLDKNNEHTVHLKVGDAKFELTTPAQKTNLRSLLIFIGIIMVLAVLFFVYKKKQTKEFTPAALYN